MTAPRISVLMAAFNAEPYLRESIESVLGQTLSDLELIIIDDGSTDGSWSTAQEIAARDPRVVTLRRSESGGASRALNGGLAVARGAYITRQDADDVSLPTRLEEQAAFLDANPAVGGVGTQAILMDADGRPLRATTLPEDDATIQATLSETMSVLGPTIMVRRTAFERAGVFFDEDLSGSEDYDLCLRLGEVSQLANLPGRLYQYRQHPASVSRRQRQDQLCRKAMALERSLHRRFGADPPAASKLEVARDYFRAAFVAHAVDDTAGRVKYFQRGLAAHPGIVEQIPLIEKMVRRYTPAGSNDAALAFTQSLFQDVLPGTRELKALRRRLVSELHARAVFASSSDWERIRTHLWLAMRLNPRWILDRGLWTTAFRGFFRRPLSPKPPSPAA